MDVLATIQSRVSDSADRHLASSRSLGLREMMRCATTAAARAIDSRIGGSLDNRSSAAAAAAGGIPVDPRMGPSVSEVLWIYYTHTHRSALCPGLPR